MGYSRPDKDLTGLSGWLILVGIALVLTPISMLGSFGELGAMFTDGDWGAITMQDSPFYNPLVEKLIRGERIADAVLIVGALGQLCLFFTKHHLFPRVFIAFTLLNAVVQLAGTWAFSTLTMGLITPRELLTTEGTRAVIAVLIWVPYMMVSERVSETFVKLHVEPVAGAAV